MAMDTHEGERLGVAQLAAEQLFRVHLELAKPIVMPGTRHGARLYEGVLGGTVTGPRITAWAAEHGGCIHTTVHEDGWAEVELRVLLATDDHAVVEIAGSGVLGLSPEKRARLALRFQVAHPNHAWLERVQAVGIATAGRDEITIDVYALT